MAGGAPGLITHPLAKVLEEVGDDQESLSSIGYGVGSQGLRGHQPVPIRMKMRVEAAVGSGKHSISGNHDERGASLNPCGNEALDRKRRSQRPVVDCVAVAKTQSCVSMMGPDPLVVVRCNVCVVAGR